MCRTGFGKVSPMRAVALKLGKQDALRVAGQVKHGRMLLEAKCGSKPKFSREKPVDVLVGQVLVLRFGEKCVVVGAGQQIPEGVLLDATACPLPTGSVVHVTAQIKRSGTKRGNCRWPVGEPSLAGLAADRA